MYFSTVMSTMSMTSLKHGRYHHFIYMDIHFYCWPETHAWSMQMWHWTEKMSNVVQKIRISRNGSKAAFFLYSMLDLYFYHNGLKAEVNVTYSRTWLLHVFLSTSCWKGIKMWILMHTIDKVFSLVCYSKSASPWRSERKVSICSPSLKVTQNSKAFY